MSLNGTTWRSDLEGEAEGEGEGELDDIIIADNTEDVLIGEYPADCCPDACYKKFPFLAGDDDAPFWQGWANLRLKTYQLIENKYFETAVITMILLSSMALVSAATHVLVCDHAINWINFRVIPLFFV